MDIEILVDYANPKIHKARVLPFRKAVDPKRAKR